MKGCDPFTMTPGIAGKAYIDSHYTDTIIHSLTDPESEKFVFRIVGLRGAGKSVAYSKIIQTLKKEKSWLVYALSAAGNPTETLISKLSDEKFYDSIKHSSSVGVSAGISGSLPILSGTAAVDISKNSIKDDHYYSAEAELGKMVDAANASGYRILIGIDDISKTKDIVRFLSIFGSFLLEGKKIYLLCTGLSKNIEEFSDQPNLTFFKRSDSVEIKGLNRYDISEMYQKFLGVDSARGAELAKIVKGYAYAYQVLGSLIFESENNNDLKAILSDFDRIMSRDSYDLIWKSLTPAERSLVKIIVNSDSGKVSEIKSSMESPGSFSSLIDRLKQKHLICNNDRGYVSIVLPRFKEFVNIWE